MQDKLSSALPIHALAAQVGALLQQKAANLHRRILHGGGLVASITEIAGSSAWFECGFITYSNAMKTKNYWVCRRKYSPNLAR